MCSRTPGTLYTVLQWWPALRWRVVSVNLKQGEAMRRRGDSHVYDTGMQAHAIADRLNRGRDADRF